MQQESETIDHDLFEGVVTMCNKMHVTVRDKSVQYAEEMRRFNYVTPTSYLELINVIKMVLQRRENYLTERRNRCESSPSQIRQPAHPFPAGVKVPPPK